MICLILPWNMVQAAPHEEDMRAVWISTIYNLDYPSTKNNIEAQQSEFIQKLETLQEMGINTVIVQVRPKADALYKSQINPWSEVLTGTQGKDPGYDPMAFMIEEAHKRGMAFHAWLNPYRVTTSGTDVLALSENHPARLNPLMTFSYNGKLYYNPESEEVKQHIVETVKEIAINYEVDGIHFDDYFYPSSYPLPQGETKDGQVANARRQAINDMISRVSTAVKQVNKTYHKDVMFGISPPGIWKNEKSDLTGSATAGNEAYYSVFADSRTWIQNGWVDYIVPQIYWQTGHSKADYETLVKWWAREVADTKVKLYIGQGVYNDSVATEIDTQLAINQKYDQIKGSVYFSLRDLLNDRMGCQAKITAFYKNSLPSKPEEERPEDSIEPPSEEIIVDEGVSAIGKGAIVTVNSLNVRTGARVDRPLVTQVKAGTSMILLDWLGGWYKVRLADGKTGWVNAAYIKVTETVPEVIPDQEVGTVIPSQYPRKGIVDATTLNVRSGARIDRDIVAKLTRGTEVTLASELGDWYKIKMANGTVGWVNKDYIR